MSEEARQTFIVLGMWLVITMVLGFVGMAPVYAVGLTAIGMGTVLGVYTVVRVLHRLDEVVELLRQLEARDRVS